MDELFLNDLLRLLLVMTAIAQQVDDLTLSQLRKFPGHLDPKVRASDEPQRQLRSRVRYLNEALDYIFQYFQRSSWFMDFDVLKYFSWGITLAISFFGAWFFQFTTTDKETNRKHFTRFGRVAFVVATIGIVLSTYLMIEGDRQSRNSKSQAATESENQRKLISAEREKSAQFRAAMTQDRRETKRRDEEVLKFVRGLVDKGAISKEEFSKVAATAFAMEDVRRVFPDIATRLDKASSVNEILTLSKELISKNAAKRFNSASNSCTKLFAKMKDAEGWLVSIKSNRNLVFNAATSASWVHLSVTNRKDASSKNDHDISNGNLFFVFDDGGEARIDSQ